ncbi:MAG: hypothetical protein IJ179_08595 [Oscillospiraceae bacterium]|nr:hypothetical protein [Oscillospiraceae bacterium]
MRIHKRPDTLFLRAMATLLFLALCAWLGAGLHRAMTPAPGMRADAGAADDPAAVTLRGVAVRRERLLCSRRRVRLAAADGKRLAEGAELAVTAGGTALYTDSSAVFFADWDGLEWLDPEALAGLDVPAAEALLAAEPQSSAGAYGRLVTGTDWYFAALSDDELPLNPGGRCLLRFQGLDRALPARLLSVSEAYGGQRAVLLRLTEGGEDCLSLRKCDAQLFLFQETLLMNQEKEG